MAEELGERTEQPTGRRRADARERGQVARSQDLGAAIDLIGAALLLVVGGGWLVASMRGVMLSVLDDFADAHTADPSGVLPLVKIVATQVGIVLLPIMLIMLAVGVLGQVIQVGWHPTSGPLTPKLDRLNPVNGFKQLFSPRHLVKTMVGSVKLAVAAVITAVFLSSAMGRIAALPALTLPQATAEIGRLALELSAWLLILLLVIGIADWMYQRWQHTKDLMMTKQEVKEERKSMDGDPLVRGRRLRMMRDIALHRINNAVPQADVIVTNPTHYSVALKYDQSSMRAPRVVAKGADFMAFRIRELAAAHQIPVIERPPLARGLFYGVEVGREIAPEFYEAVAEVLAYVYRLERKAA